MGASDGGPAFAGEKSVRFGQTNDCNEGMSLRDYFAAKALPVATKQFEDGHPNGWHGIAIVAYVIADALIAARETKNV